MLDALCERSDRMLLRLEEERRGEGEVGGEDDDDWRGCSIQSSDRSSMKALSAAGRGIVACYPIDF